LLNLRAVVHGSNNCQLNSRVVLRALQLRNLQSEDSILLSLLLVSSMFPGDAVVMGFSMVIWNCVARDGANVRSPAAKSGVPRASMSNRP